MGLEYPLIAQSLFSELPQGVWTVLGMLVTGVLGYMGIKVQQRSEEVGKSQDLIAVTADTYGKIIHDLQAQADRDRAVEQEHRREFLEHKSDMEALIRAQGNRITELEQELDRWRRWGVEMTRYIAGLPDTLRQAAPPPPF